MSDRLSRAAKFMTDEDLTILVRATQMYRNWLTTGNVNLSLADVSAIGEKDAMERFGAKVQILTNEQMTLVINVEGLIYTLLNCSVGG